MNSFQLISCNIFVVFSAYCLLKRMGVNVRECAVGGGGSTQRRNSLTQQNNCGGDGTNGEIQNQQRTDTQPAMSVYTLLSAHASDVQMRRSGSFSVVCLTVESQTAGEPLTVPRRCPCPKREFTTPNPGGGGENGRV